ncbi:hypothetical protein F441_16131 [Phytophthora nicotianae CJ01A1]|uniref:Uncharacterized protein n=5 Tax=Phytophthora nicotianae TaxID=4792 RepID=V9EFA3_PHYNI|nr:hypothetical protein F443_16309 [Phytophthora nicotianae P1569]ETK78043.1 hypothetical protein L915_15855 [Phytophthora nicotianae]ETO66616.1 hypothetical protein F444_16301 [Phytophthora nicotianae P1976]ETP07717.1 hypothetical protein F441_16131 [Phytophthora nicotianae CJ01A1]ETP35759.1 hypothetical protein F442_16162 [Phytophthora nicotianae P10297]
MPILELYLTITDSDDLPIFIYCAATRKTGGVEQTFSVPTSIYTPRRDLLDDVELEEMKPFLSEHATAGWLYNEAEEAKALKQ